MVVEAQDLAGAVAGMELAALGHSVEASQTEAVNLDIGAPDSMAAADMAAVAVAVEGMAAVAQPQAAAVRAQALDWARTAERAGAIRSTTPIGREPSSTTARNTDALPDRKR